jgi:short-subunit dehydrogenase
MPKIYLFGGQSELGNSAVKELVRARVDHFSDVIKVQRSGADADDKSTVIWNPETSESILGTISSLNFESGDLAIIAVGSTSQNDTSSNFKLLDAKEIGDLVWINFGLPMTLTGAIAEKLFKVGGGTILVFTSTAAFPPQAGNVIYSNSKFALDNSLGMLTKSFSASNVSIMRVRSSFSPTKLNRGRSATPFSVSVEQVGISIAEAYKQGRAIVWIPAVFKVVAWALRNLPYINRIAEKLVRRSGRL